MADNDQSKVRYDDFVSKVQADPASPQSTIMLQGYAGHGPEGHIRIYPDPTLGHWYDVPEGDVVHSMPIDDSKLGGSYVWIKSNSAIKPGSAEAAAPQGPAPAAAPVAAAPHLLPTPQTLCQPTPQTHCFICPPHTQPPQCPVLTHGVCTHPPLCPIHTPDCPIQSAACPPPHTAFCPSVNPAMCPHTPLPHCPPPHTPFCPSVHPAFCPHTLPHDCPTHSPFCPTQPIVCQQVVTHAPGCGFGNVSLACGVQPGGQQILPQAMAAPAPAPAAAQAFSQHICPTPSVVDQCGQPHQTQVVLCTNPLVCGGHTMHQCPSVQVICPTPTVTNHIVCHQSLGIGCLQTAQTPCFPQTFGACPSIACHTPQFTPIQNGVFNPFGR